ncbi:MAG: hypothetical protein M1830_009464 [Pleopsidium flavum]|nr:MAG: hypothetical protein M1830_009464 [Pleopsidium flavum]
MKFSQSVVALVAAAGLSTASPVKRQAPAITDADILNYALTLEHLEDKFYREGLANYTQEQFASAGFDATFYKNLMTVSKDEQTHVKFLTDALTAAGATPVAECTYNYGVSDPKAFVALASVLEGVGVTAYLGAAADIMSKEYLTDAGSILTVEARHSSYIRAALGEVPFPSPFDVPLTFDEVYTLAAPFIVSCPSSNPKLPVKAFPMLALGTKGTIKSNDTITLNTPGYNLKAVDGSSQLYAAFITVTGPIFGPATPVDGGFSVMVPEGVNGQSYVVLTGCKDAVTDDTVAAGPAIVEVTNY